MAKQKFQPVELPEHLAGIPEKPETILNDAIASETWDTVVEELHAQKILATTDRYILLSLCCRVSTLIQAREILAKEGWVTVNGKNGAIKSHPMLNIEATACRDIHAFASELGLSPLARAKITPVESIKKKLSMDEETDADD